MPQCYVLDDITQCVNESESAWEDFMMWFFGLAGTGTETVALLTGNCRY
jgi:hypothetical protein